MDGARVLRKIAAAIPTMIAAPASKAICWQRALTLTAALSQYCE
jgi:hypothetical protein